MTRYIQTLLLGFAVVAAATPLHAQTNPTTVNLLDPAHDAACANLALIVLPEEGQAERVDQMMDGLLATMFQQDKEMQELELEFPGMRAAMATGMKPVLYRNVSEAMPQYRAELAALYCANLATPEVNQAAAMFRSPAMRKLVAGLNANMKFDRMAKDAMAEKDFSNATVQATITSAASTATQGLSVTEQAQIQAFFASPLGSKLRSLNPQKLEIDTKWANYSTPEAEQEIEAAVFKAMVGHIRKTDPKLADLMLAELSSDMKSN